MRGCGTVRPGSCDQAAAVEQQVEVERARRVAGRALAPGAAVLDGEQRAEQRARRAGAVSIRATALMKSGWSA